MNSLLRDTRRSRSLGASRLSALAALGLAVAAAQAFAQQPARQPAQRAAAAQEPPSFLAEELDEETATVTAIDPSKRLISLKDEDDGSEFTVEAGDDVRNFAQIKVGDEVNVQYYQALAAEVTKAEASADDDAVVLGSRAAEGDRPAGGVGTLYTAIVTIDSIDPATNTVSFTGPEGKQRETTVERDEGREFIRQLKPGDRVQLTYGEALAIAVAPADEDRALR
jgi:hypothetical protein